MHEFQFFHKTGLELGLTSLMHLFTWIVLSWALFVHNQQVRSEQADEDLWDEFSRKKSRESLGILFERYAHLVYGVCLKYLEDPDTAKDGVIQVFEQLLTKKTTADVKNFKSWLYVVTKNYCLMQLRAAKSRSANQEKFLETGTMSMESDQLVHPIDEDPDLIDSGLLEKAISRLPDEQQVCIRLFYLEERSYKDIVIQTGFELKKVKSYIQNGKRNLKGELSQYGTR